ncbi:FHIPEP family type III secretion protein [Leptolyngbya cf. ectocarpi LEGE 11479]|uniref:FHIPEP family type III secretion protein n=2 Tax=Leptolyngbya ectocarpi TaxID=1202 RepID=A0A929A090_LEPEC|nr:FHIPEP family type III secretion protein [Leptolyngbya cf. ectocarpi LEGE 11479]
MKQLDTVLAEYELKLMFLESANTLPSAGNGLLIVAKIENFYHVRIFDRTSKKVIDMGKDEFSPDASLALAIDTALKKKSVDNQTKTELIQKITSNLDYQHPQIDHEVELELIQKIISAANISVDDFRLIYRIFIQSMQEGKAVNKIIQQIRLNSHIRNYLWGNDQEYDFLYLEDDLIKSLEINTISSVVDIVAVNPTHFLNEMRKKMDEHKRYALVVSKQKYRALVRGILDLEFPHIPVLSIDEKRFTLQKHDSE